MARIRTGRMILAGDYLGLALARFFTVSLITSLFLAGPVAATAEVRFQLAPSAYQGAPGTATDTQAGTANPVQSLTAALGETFTLHVWAQFDPAYAATDWAASAIWLQWDPAQFDLADSYLILPNSATYNPAVQVVNWLISDTTMGQQALEFEYGTYGKMTAGAVYAASFTKKTTDSATIFIVGDTIPETNVTGCGVIDAVAAETIPQAVYGMTVFGADTSGANHWYVSTTGDTSNDGLTPATAKRYPSQAVALLTAGDTINLAAGSYADTIAIDTDFVAILGADSTTTLLDCGDSSLGTNARGIYADTQLGLIIRNLQVTNAYDGIYWSNVDNSSLENMTVTWCGQDGISLNGGSDFDTVLNAVSRNNVGSGVNLTDCNNGVFTGNSWTDNTNMGLVLTNSSYHLFRGNEALRNGLPGIDLMTASNSNLIEGNTVRANGGGLAFSSSTDYNSVQRNIVTDNNGTGISIYGANEIYLAQNTVDSNAGYQFSIEAASVADTFQKNVVRVSELYPDSLVLNEAAAQFNLRYNWWNSTDSAWLDTGVVGAQADSALWQPFRLGTVDTAANADTVAPAAPDTLAVSDTSGGAIVITWGVATTNEEVGGALSDLAGYRVYRSLTADTNYWGLPIADTTATTGVDNTPVYGNTYYYRVTAYDNHSPWANESWYTDSILAVAYLLPDTSGPNAWYVNDGNTSGDSFCAVVGDTANTGLSPSQPKFYLDQVEGLLTAGDTIYLDAGTFYEPDTVTITCSTVWLIGKDSAATVIDFVDSTAARVLLAAPILSFLTIVDLKLTNGEDGFDADSLANSTIARVAAVGNLESGFSLEGGTNNYLGICDASNNGIAGIELTNGGSGNTITGNAATNNETWGILVEAGANNTLTNNSVSGNTPDPGGNVGGIELSAGSTGNTLSGNTVAGNTSFGILVTSGSNGNAIVNNTITGSGVDGVVIVSSNNNSLAYNVSQGNGDYGFNVDYGAASNTLWGNDASNNSGGGFAHNSPNNTYSGDNVSANSGDYQIGFCSRITSDPAAADTISKCNIITHGNNPDSGVAFETPVLVPFYLTRSWWGTTDSVAIQQKVWGSGSNWLVYQPFRLGPVDTAAGADSIAPASPDTVVVSDSATGSCTLTWGAAYTNEEIGGALTDFAGYRVYRSTTADTSYWPLLGTTAATTWADTTVGYDTYYYRITAYDNHAPWENESWYSESVPAAVFAPPDTSGPNQWYVATGGDPSNDGLSVGAPKKYLAEMTGLLTAGDTVNLAAGTWYETMTISTDSVALLGVDSATTILASPVSQTETVVLGLNAGGLLFRGLQFTDAARGLALVNAPFATVESCSFILNDSDGLYLGGGSDSVTVTGCGFDDNLNAALLLDSAARALISNNRVTVSGGTGFGFRLEYSDSNVVTGNIATGITAFYLVRSNYNDVGSDSLTNARLELSDSSCWNRIADNTVQAVTNAGNEAYLIGTGCNWNTISGNQAINVTAPYKGFYLGNCWGNTLDGNTCQDVGNVSYQFGGASANTISNNTAVNSGNLGFYFSSGSNDNLISGNTATNSTLGGFRVDASSGNRLLNNVSSFNQNGAADFNNTTGNVVAQHWADSNTGNAFVFWGAADGDVITKSNIHPRFDNPDSGARNISTGSADLRRCWWGTTDSSVIAVMVWGPGEDSLAWQPYRLGVCDTGAGADTIAPAAPDTVVVSDSATGSCTLTWGAAYTNEEIGGALADLAGYRVYRSGTADTNWWAPIGSTAVTTFCDTTVGYDTYYYRVTAYDNHSPWENESWYGDSTPGVSFTMPDTSGSNAWYVAITGDTANDGLSAGLPKRYFSQVTGLLSAGDTLFIAAGTYSETIAVDTDNVFIVGADSTATILDFGDSTAVTAAYGIFADTQTGLTIRNLTIRNCYRGIYFVGMTNSLIEDVVCEYNFDRGSLFELSSNNTVRRETVRYTTGSGYGICMIEGSLNNLIEECSSHNNAQNGICINTAHGAILRHNHTRDNAAYGIYLSSCDSVTTYSNETHGNAFGLYYDATTSGGHHRGNNAYNNNNRNFQNATAGNAFDIRRNYWGSSANDTTALLLTLAGGDQYFPFRYDFIDTAAGADTVAPATMTGLVADSTTSGGTIILTWDQVALDEDGNALADFAGYRLYRVTDDTAILGSPIWTFASVSDTTFSDSMPPAPGMRYWYRVTAFDSAVRPNEGGYAEAVGIANFAPLALTMADTTVGLAELVLDGTASGDSSPDNLSFAWSQLAGETLAIGNPAASVASCTGVIPGTFVFLLTVTDSWGASGADTVQVVVVDSALPASFDTSVVINGDSAACSGETVTLALFGDTLAVEMMIANDSAFTVNSGWLPFSAGYTWALAGGETQSVYVQFRNGLGLAGSIASDSIFVDTGAPAGVNVVILEGTTTVTPSVTLKLETAEDSTVLQYRVSEFADFNDAAWTNFGVGETLAFVLSAGSETKTVYYAVRDAAGNVVTDTAQVYLAGMPYPVVGLTGTALSGGSVRLTWSASPSSDRDTYQVYCNWGAGTISYAAPCASLDTTALSWETGPLTVGETWVFGVRVTGAGGSEENNTNLTVTVQIRTDTGNLYAAIVIPDAGKRLAGNQHLIKADVYGDTSLGAWVTFEYRLGGAVEWTPVPAANANHPNPDDSEPWMTHWNLDLMAEGNYELRGVAWNLSETDPNPGIIAVTIDRQNPDVNEYLNDTGNVQKKERVYSGAAVGSEVADTGGLYGVEIPAGQVNSSTSLNIQVFNDSATGFAGAGNRAFDTGGTVMEVTLDNGQTAFGDTIYIRVPFQDNNSDSIIDGTRVRLNLVQILYWSSTDGLWHAVARENTWVDAALHQIIGAVDHLSKFAAGKEYVGGDLGVDGSDAVPDGDVDGSDLAVFNGTFGSTAGGGNYNENADIVTTGTSEGRIDAEDLFEVGRTYGTQ